MAAELVITRLPGRSREYLALIDGGSIVPVAQFTRYENRNGKWDGAELFREWLETNDGRELACTSKTGARA